MVSIEALRAIPASRAGGAPLPLPAENPDTESMGLLPALYSPREFPQKANT
jgi:hypothetical protein